ncbi:exosortase-associated protein EpsI, V-type [Rhizorhapis suberifaciens]|uniref:EpsI family protein n=1 Tax=Rhizorhapis suberifaciens TaxID=13656 RepID=A0A840HW40_9SPHN|nr:exosortase-associated protein EpsI, V-type [Rhizorhapis suberifaciens]MBB4641748.1 EpsI family protein [Rhizorhapis suberifaciens]
MVSRREVLAGGAGLMAAGAAWSLEPRVALNLLGRSKLATIVPDRFGGWLSEVSDRLLQPKTQGKLADILYSDTLSRIYRRNGSNDAVMMLMAYGSTQSDLLQLHRPETCYPAFGYRIEQSRAVGLRLGTGMLPARELLAVGPGRTESILYWTRVGDSLPTNSAEQRLARLRMAVAGYVPDGLLARFSVEGNDESSFARLTLFVRDLLRAVPNSSWPGLVGRSLI